MSLKILIVGIIFHALFGILAPFIFLLFPQGKTDKLISKNIAFAWLFLAWGLFFIYASVFLMSRYVLGQGPGGFVAFFIGVLPLITLAVLSFLQAFVKWRSRSN